MIGKLLYRILLCHKKLGKPRNWSLTRWLGSETLWYISICLFVCTSCCIYLFYGKSATGVSYSYILYYSKTKKKETNFKYMYFLSRSKWLFIGCLIAFSIIMAYMLFAAAWLTFKGVQGAVDDKSFFAALQENSGLRNIIISVMSTYGLYFVSSLLYRQPMHMLTSFLPYLILLPGFTNILTIYAFCNTHDVRYINYIFNQCTGWGICKK